MSERGDPGPAPVPAWTSPAALPLEAHAAWVLAWFRRRFDGHRAEDLSQEAMLIMLRNSGRIRTPAKAAGYLLGVVRRLSRDERRRMRRAQAAPLALEPAARAEMPADQDLAVAAALGRLPPELEQVLAVTYGQDLGYEEAAGLLGVPRATIQSRLRRGLARLRRELARQGVMR